MTGRILILDDEENYAEMLQELLRDNNYRVDMATRPERAIAQLEEIPYDLVISDYKMPVMDGADFLKKARELYPNLPFILVSGLMNTPELVKVANMGVTLVMEKPLDTDAFLSHTARFSTPMSDDEKSLLALEGADSTEVAGAQNYPEEPRFFSANNFLANRFLQSLWSVAHFANELYLLEPSGGDAELVLKDLSVWRSNGDAPVDVFSMPNSKDAVLSLLREEVSRPERSRVVGIRLSSTSEISRCRELTSLAQSELSDAGDLLFAYIVEGETNRVIFQEAAPDDGFIVPSLCKRPSDVAVYARRFARIAAERSGRPSSGHFTSDAIYLLLAYEWPNNYREIQSVVREAFQVCLDGPISADVLLQVLGSSISSVAPSDRIAALMRTAQSRDLVEQMVEHSLGVRDLSERLDLDLKLLTERDLEQMPLIKSELAHF